MLHAQTLVLLTRILCPEAEISDKQKKKKNALFNRQVNLALQVNEVKMKHG